MTKEQLFFFRCIPSTCSLQRSDRSLENLLDSCLTRPFSSSDRASALLTNGAAHAVQTSFVAAPFKVLLIDAALIVDEPRNY